MGSERGRGRERERKRRRRGREREGKWPFHSGDADATQLNSRVDFESLV